MSNFSEDYVGLFGIPGVIIEQTLLNEYDPYSGIDLREQSINENVCIRIEGSRAPNGTPMLDGSGNMYNFPNTNGLNDGRFYPLSLFTDIENSEQYEVCSYDFLTPGVNLNLYEIRAVCADGTIVMMGNSYGDHTIGLTNYRFESGVEACLSKLLDPSAYYKNSELYFASDKDKRQSLGVFSPDEINPSETLFTGDISDLLFQSITPANLITNGSSRLIKSDNYYPNSLGRSGATPIKPSGGWTYMKLDGTVIHLTQNETVPGGGTDNRFVQHPTFNEAAGLSPLSYGYGGYAPYLFPFEEESDPQGTFYTNFFETRPIETDYQWATWVRSDECFSHNKCLRFYADYKWYYSPFGANGNTSFIEQEYSVNGILALQEANQYRTNNQVQRIYTEYNPDVDVDGSEDSESEGNQFLNPYSGLKVSFKMKTMSKEKIDAWQDDGDVDDVHNNFSENHSLETNYVEAGIFRSVNIFNNDDTRATTLTTEAAQLIEESYEEIRHTVHFSPAINVNQIEFSDYDFVDTGLPFNSRLAKSFTGDDRVTISIPPHPEGKGLISAKIRKIMVAGDVFNSVQQTSDGGGDPPGAFGSATYDLNIGDPPGMARSIMGLNVGGVNASKLLNINSELNTHPTNYLDEAYHTWSGTTTDYPWFNETEYLDAYGIENNQRIAVIYPNRYRSAAIANWTEGSNANHYNNTNIDQSDNKSMLYIDTPPVSDTEIEDAYNNHMWPVWPVEPFGGYEYQDNDVDFGWVTIFKGSFEVDRYYEDYVDGSSAPGLYSSLSNDNLTLTVDYDLHWVGADMNDLKEHGFLLTIDCEYVDLDNNELLEYQTLTDTVVSNNFYETNYFTPIGSHNSITSGGKKDRDSFGSVARFKNTRFNIWEDMEYTFNLPYDYIKNWGSEDVDLENIKTLNFVIQTSSNDSGYGFLGEVFIDDIQVQESYDFIIDCDVRKKKGPNNYGVGDLTKYYDPLIDTEQYNDTTAPLEAQFYFYPRYNFNEVFGDLEKPIIHNDYREGMFYIYNVDWGDGSPNEFISEPKKLGENIAVYHTYETSGIFEVTGTILRMKPNKDYEPLGVIHNKNFKLFINVNEGLDEDFIYFGTDGFSFIPYKNTLPIIGGYSEQSIYYKSIERQLGFLDVEDNDLDILIRTDFRSVGDRLKTEIALDKMDDKKRDSSFVASSPLTEPMLVLKEYEKERTDENDNVIYNGIKTFSGELGKSIGDMDITNIRYFNTGSYSMYDMLGFTDEEVNNPNNERHWKNIIPKDYSIFKREGIIEEIVDGETIYRINNNILNVEQNWLDNYYYPVLPKHNYDGRFITGEYPLGKIQFPSDGSITDDNYVDESLKLSINRNMLETNVFDDVSGNNNYGFAFSDYKPEFNEQTLKPKKVKSAGNLRTSKLNGAF